jgi:hypothetical protein
MYSKKQFTALEAMCREQAALARNEMEYSLMKYWLAEAEEWKQLRQSDPFKEKNSESLNRPSKIQQRTSRMTRDGRRLLEH